MIKKWMTFGTNDQASLSSENFAARDGSREAGPQKDRKVPKISAEMRGLLKFIETDDRFKEAAVYERFSGENAIKKT